MTSLCSGYLDRTGALVIAATLRDARPFHAGVALAKPFGGISYGFLGLDGRWVVEPTIAGYQEWSEDVAGFNVGGVVDAEGDVIGGAWGLVGDGRVIVPPSLDDVGGCAQGLIAFRAGDRWGYLDRAGAVAIPPRFEDADDFSAEGLAVVTEGGRDGYLRRDGSWRLPPRFEQLAPATEGRGRARLGRVWRVIDLDGEPLSEGFDEIRPFCGGLARVVRGGRIGYVDHDGRLLGDGWFDEATRYDRLAPVRRGDAWFVLDARGALHGPFARALPPTEGLVRFVDAAGLVGFLDGDGAIRVPARYTNARPFHEGRAAVERDGAWTFVAPTGAELHDPYWHHAGTFREGLCPVRYGARAGCVDLAGRVAIPLEWDVIGPFSGGRAAAKQIAWRPVAPPPPAWHVAPREGLAFRGFAGAGVDDALRVAIGFADDVVEGDSLRLQHVLHTWADVADAHAGGDAIEDEWVGGDILTVRFGGVPYPVELAQVLIEEIRALGLPIKDVALARFRPADDPALAGPGGTVAVPDPDDPRGPVIEAEPFDAFVARALTGDPPPASEVPAELLAGRLDPGTDEVAYAERTFTLHVPGIRIVYGARRGGPGAPPPADARGREVAEAVTRALAARFDRARVWVSRHARDPGLPVPRTRAGEPGVEAIHVDLPDGARRGHAFSIDAATLLHDLGPTHHRYRENELMEALADAIRAAGLAPVILWQRLGDPLPGATSPDAAHPRRPTLYVVDLWDPA